MMMMTMVDEDEYEEISPIIQLFERLTFERGHEVHEQVTSMIDFFSSSDVRFVFQFNNQIRCFFSLGYIRYVRYVD